MNNKAIKFATELVPLILTGEKTSTWRLFDDKDLQTGDQIELFEFGQDQPFATAVISTVVETTFGKLTAEDKAGHEDYSDDQDMYDTFSGYYKTEVGSDTELKIIHFEVK